LKRARQSETRNARNNVRKTRVKNAIKKTRLSIAEDASKAPEALRKAMSILHKAASKGALHPRNAARRIARLSKSVSAAGDKK
jgi:small subunit ribosomal protein S20